MEFCRSRNLKAVCQYQLTVSSVLASYGGMSHMAPGSEAGPVGSVGRWFPVITATGYAAIHGRPG